MNRRPRATSASVLQVLLQLSLLLTATVPSTFGEGKRNLGEAEAYAELRCTCIQTTSGIHPSNIQNLKMFRAGPPLPQCRSDSHTEEWEGDLLKPNAPLIKKIIPKFLEGDESAA
ncbi:hypothetical protein QTO34_008302 [Cnephaeus nilssonii]|uniref:Uncharacterized protein n=1 Tax=Cnephaeus nilssonii TaxID=3371016 RepID=A0AA40IB48_CNENI|nr:hypothetical protein QTO34_008302 [Eptesicus nilssonii]